MGHRDSSAQFSGHDAVCAANHGIAEATAPRLRGGQRRSLAAWALLALVRFYVVLLSPILGGACKFYPSCSNYAYEAVARHGARRGSLLAIKRLLRCRPFTKGGFDPVPDSIGEGVIPPLEPSSLSGLDGAVEPAGRDHSAGSGVKIAAKAIPGTELRL